MTEQILNKELENKLSPEELQNLKDKIAFPRKERITFRSQEIYIKPLPLSYSKRAFKGMEDLIKFTRQFNPPQENNEEIQSENDLVIAEAMTNTFKILVEFYKIEIKDDSGNTPKDIEDIVTYSEIVPLLEAQVGIEEEQNFLFFPWRSMLILNRLSKEFSMLNQVMTDQNQSQASSPR